MGLQLSLISSYLQVLCACSQDNAMMRVQCKLEKSGEVGWVTTKGNQGTRYLEPFSPYETWKKACSLMYYLRAGNKNHTHQQEPIQNASYHRKYSFNR